jgi:hypothetical protein
LPLYPRSSTLDAIHEKSIEERIQLTRGRKPPPSATRQPGLVPISCPDCFGVLHFLREGPQGHLMYECQVKHRYSLSSLLHSMEAHLERSLRSSSLLLTQLDIAYQDLLDEVKNTPPADRQRVQRRIKEVRKQCLAVQAIIEASHAVE